MSELATRLRAVAEEVFQQLSNADSVSKGNPVSPNGEINRQWDSSVVFSFTVLHELLRKIDIKRTELSHVLWAANIRRNGNTRRYTATTEAIQELKNLFT